MVSPMSCQVLSKQYLGCLSGHATIAVADAGEDLQPPSKLGSGPLRSCHRNAILGVATLEPICALPFGFER